MIRVLRMRCTECRASFDIAEQNISPADFLACPPLVPKHDYDGGRKHMCPSCICEQPRLACPGAGKLSMAQAGVGIPVGPDDGPRNETVVIFPSPGPRNTVTWDGQFFQLGVSR